MNPSSYLWHYRRHPKASQVSAAVSGHDLERNGGGG
jgi:hypothetical protein